MEETGSAKPPGEKNSVSSCWWRSTGPLQGPLRALFSAALPGERQQKPSAPDLLSTVTEELRDSGHIGHVAGWPQKHLLNK